MSQQSESYLNRLVNVNLTLVIAACVPLTVPAGHSIDTSDILWSLCVSESFKINS